MQTAPKKPAPLSSPAVHPSDDLDVARRVLRLAAEGVQAVASQLDGAFVAALDLIAAATGRVIVTGMGKSGHVGRKIAATLASTGTPAQFVHPGEASHGDLGMITRADLVLALSNSGETEELGDVVAYARRFRIPMVAMTRGASSSLADAADVVLLLPSIPEACPMGLAPTTSTTMMLAFGDALAVALLERRGFTAQDFQVLHPRGALGKRLLRVADLMHTGPGMPLTLPHTSMSDVILIMTEKRDGRAGVVGVTGVDGRLLGVITDGDLRRHMGGNLLAMRADAVMTPHPVTIRPQALAAEAVGLMNARSITSLFVVDDERPAGILHLHDCLQAGVG